MESKHPILPYFVSDTGNIKKIKGNGYKVQTRSKFGYHQISYGYKTYLVHRVVWEAFNGVIPKGMQINHIDGNKSNNYLFNLELVTPADNMKHAVKIGLKDGKNAEDNSMAKLTNNQYYELIHKIVNGATNKEIANEYQLHPRYVSLIRHKKRLRNIWEKYSQESGISSASKSSGLNSKIPVEIRVEIIKKLPYFKNKELAQEINVDCSVISQVRHKKAWADAWNIVNTEGATTIQ
ncbi:MAG: HNH endonuclease signature motif containing protein [Xenococcaceae cyanobacterium]